LTQGTGITITNGNGTITIAASGGGGSGDVVGPASSTDNAFARFDSTTGKLLQNSTGATLSDTGAAVFTGALDVLGNSTAGSNLKLYEDTDNGTNYVAFKAPDTIASNVTWTLPATDGTSAQVLSTNGSGTLSWATAGSGSSQWTTSGTQIYYNTGNVGIGTTSPDTYTDGAKNLTLLSSSAGRSNFALVGTQSSADEILGRLNFTNTNTSNAAYRLCMIDAKRGSDNNSGYFDFSTSNAGTTAVRARITQSGNLLVGTTTETSSAGVLQVSNGITFPATQSASSDANTLDDYEEGTWTPSATPEGGSLTTYSSSGRYTKVGRQVFLNGQVLLTTVGTSSGTLGVSNLPFSIDTSTVQMQAHGVSREVAATGYEWFINSRGSATVLGIGSITNGAITWSNGYQYSFSITYTV